MAVSKEEVGQVVTSCMEMDLEQLLNINKIVVSRIKDKRKQKAKRKAQLLNVGDPVTVDNDERLEGRTGIIEKIMRTRAKVNFQGEVWTCPLTVINKKEV